MYSNQSPEKAANANKSKSRKLSKMDFSTIEFMNYLADQGVIDYNWQESIGSKLFKKIREKTDAVFNFYSNTKEFMKIKLIKEILEKQTIYQEETLSNIINKGSG
jgi:hypothetical protein